MRRVSIGSASISTTSLGLGTSRLHYIGSRERHRLLEEALARGVRHFDTAPVYGDGLAEECLGLVLRRVRPDVVIATKAGITPDPLVVRYSLPLWPARAARRIFPRAAGSIRPPLTAACISESLDASLRRLRTDYVDLLLLHEPGPDRLVEADDLLGLLQTLRNTGKVRAFGLAGSWEGVTASRAALPREAWIIQTAESGWQPPAVPDITYGVLARGPQAFGQAGVDGHLAIGRLRAARARRPDGVLLVATTRPERIAELVEAGA